MAKKINRNPNDFEPIVVNGCYVEPNTVYEVVPKEPSSKTPQVYLELGSVKERFPGVGNTVTLTQADTGFFDSSPSFNKVDTLKNNWDKRQETADKYYEIFASPMRNYIADIERIKIPTDNEFFDKAYQTGYLTTTVSEGVQFNTANPVDRFRLFIALQEGELCMKGVRTPEEKELGLKDEKDIFNQDAQYAFISITENKSKKEQIAEMEMDAAYTFGNLRRSNKKTLMGMLSYINIPVKVDTSDAELDSIYKTKVEPNREKLKEFIDITDRYSKQPDLMDAEFDLFDKIKSKKGRDLIKKEGTSFYFGDTVLGSNYKSVVATLLKPENTDVLKQFHLNFE